MEKLDGQQPTKQGLSRRDIIKRAAIAGGVAWTAPVLIESLASPAGAVTPPPGFKCSGNNLEADRVMFTLTAPLGPPPAGIACTGGTGVPNTACNFQAGYTDAGSSPCAGSLTASPCGTGSKPWATLTYNTISCPSKYELRLVPAYTPSSPDNPSDFPSGAGGCFFSNDVQQNGNFVYARYQSTDSCGGNVSTTTGYVGSIPGQPSAGGSFACIDPSVTHASGTKFLTEVSAHFCCPANRNCH